MKKRIHKSLEKLNIWIIANLPKIMIIVGVHVILTFLLNLPYINLIKIIISYFPYLVDWILILVLFRPKKQLILKGSLYLLIAAFFLQLLGLKQILEIVGVVIYTGIATYILLSLKEIRYKDND